MVYRFFERWKLFKTELFSINKEISEVEKVYKLKLKLLSMIFSAIKNETIDFKSVDRLSRLMDKRSTCYSSILKKLDAITSLAVKIKEVHQFYELVMSLEENVKSQKSILLPLLEKLANNSISNTIQQQFYELQDLLKVESEFIQIEDKEFRKLEDLFLLKKYPGAEIGGYTPLIQAIEEGKIIVVGEKLICGDTEIQGLNIASNLLIMRADHYTKSKNAGWIENDEYVAPSFEDPYSYFVERGMLSNKSRSEIQKYLGVTCAESVIGLEIVVSPEQVWVKKGKNGPLKIAISCLSQRQVRKILSVARKVA